mmetsp:Transcript_83864/g.166430  ORF Transcript_83864/g.166430 Transcript_83864/m.166430 type:complete len:204 (+) Transcript_83864:170-781(+)
MKPAHQLGSHIVERDAMGPDLTLNLILLVDGHTIQSTWKRGQWDTTPEQCAARAHVALRLVTVLTQQCISTSRSKPLHCSPTQYLAATTTKATVPGNQGSVPREALTAANETHANGVCCNLRAQAGFHLHSVYVIIVPDDDKPRSVPPCSLQHQASFLARVATRRIVTVHSDYGTSNLPLRRESSTRNSQKQSLGTGPGCPSV